MRVNGTKPEPAYTVIQRLYVCSCGHTTELPPTGLVRWVCECGEAKECE